MEDQPMVVDDLLSSPTKSDAMVGVTEYDNDNDNDEHEHEHEHEATRMIQSPLRTASVSSSSLLENGHDEHQDMLIRPQEPPFAVDDKVLCPHGSPSSSDNNATPATMLYPSVVRKVRFNAAGSDNLHPHHSSAGQWEFLVHFVGWHARYDKWMRPGDLVVDTPEARAANEARMPPPPGASQTLSSSSSRKRKKERTVELAAEGEVAEAAANEQGGSADSSSGRAKAHKRSSTTAVPTAAASRGSLPFEEYCELPLTLKTVLWDEWERLNPRDYLFHNPDSNPNNNSNQDEGGATTAHAAGVVRTRLPTRVVHDLPSKATVRYVVSHFAKTATQKCRETSPHTDGTAPAASNGGTHPSGATPDQIQEFCAGLLQLFETALPICLLYPQERPQYDALLAEHRRKQREEDGDRSEPSTTTLQLSAVYGCEHLLRLLVRLPVLLQGESQPNTSNSERPVGGGQQLRNKWMGPLLSELVLLLQKNRSQIFSKSGYRPPHVPNEYLEWERDLYGMNA
jgi:MRG